MPTIAVKVKPHSRFSALTPCPDGTYTAQLKSLPVDGKANAELILLVARHFGCAASAVTLKHGSRGRTKLIHVADLQERRSDP